ncbi:MAG: carboxylating nicotinate-nucleotide diphosphorylase [Desulfobulbaceae bacterium]|nr:carboxylating nicotinate-nucleotide diphosphorylase [Desulfobulbaceae bacterium]
MNLLVLDNLLRGFLAEDIGRGDVTSEAVFSETEHGSAVFRAKESLVAAGMDKVAGRVFHLLDERVELEQTVSDGTSVEAGTVLLRVNGPVRALLTAERTALNLVQRLCGIASMTAAFVEAARGTNARICDTRKTTPGLRMLEKYAVLAGGGANHRFNLADGVMIKDNHIEACGSIAEAVCRVRMAVPHTLRIEVETENMAHVRQCIENNVDIIMLDNMDTATMREAVGYIDGRALVEASGNMSLERIAEVAATGVDLISVGALTHSAGSRDISMDWLSKG